MAGYVAHGEGPDPAEQMLALKDADLVYRACSEAFARALGFRSPHEIVGRTDKDLFPADEALQRLRADSRTILEGKSSVAPVVSPVKEKTPQDKPRLLLRKPVLDADNRVSGIELRIIHSPVAKSAGSALAPGAFNMDTLTMRADDVSVRRKPTGADFARLIEAMPHGVVIIRGARLVYANREAATMLGYPSPVALLRTGVVTSILRIDEWLKSRKGQLPVARGMAGLAERFELQGIAKDGTTLALHARAREVDWLNEKAIQISFADYTEDLLAEEMLAQSELRYRNYARAGGDFFFDTDERLQLSYVSDAMQAVFGLSERELASLTLHEIARRSQALYSDEQYWSDQMDRLLHRQPFSDFDFRWPLGENLEHVIRISAVPVFDQAGRFTGYQGSGREITHRHRHAALAEFHASHDPLTGLFNRRRFEESVRVALTTARTGEETHALCFMDLDSFKIVNDTCGHHAGDELLRQLAELFNRHVRKSDVLGRIGGDEFAILLYNCGTEEAVRLANQLRSEVENFEFFWEQQRFKVGISVGAALIDRRWDNVGSLFRAADSACYLAKDRGRNRVVVYTESKTHERVREGETHWVDQINRAIAEERITISQQPIRSLKKQGRRSVEILMRLRTRAGAIINPKAFLPAAERYGLATRLDLTVIDATLQWLAAKPDMAARELDLISINLTGPSISSEDFTGVLLGKINGSGIPARKFCFELTETAVVANLTAAKRFIHAMVQAGCRITIDNFGSGLSSFAYIRDLPVHFLKIDGMFIRDILEDPVDRAMVKAINDIGQTTGRRTIASFVENAHLLEALEALGVDYVQGYHIGEPQLVYQSAGRGA
ncbi:EAL domain-containing protein [Granulosicoccaceae sp. 1_MG-2023]|nr:EAL domain-containing protein [Granulosicoccaceae sp. 1_MG-2023]